MRISGRSLRLLIGAAAAAALVLSVSAAAADGDLDPSFGPGGIVITDFGDDDLGGDLALQPDGRMVVAGTTGCCATTQGDFALARYASTGSLDPTFGAGGKVRTDFAGDDDEAHAVALQPDGKIVVAGLTDVSGEFTGNFALARYLPDGALDSSFGTGGLVTTDFHGGDDTATDIALEPDGRIVVAGTSNVSGQLTGNFALARYNPDGSLDTGFGAGGKVTTDFGLDDEAFAVASQPDGEIVVAGTTLDTTGNTSSFALARYNPDGSLDAGFGSGGKVTTFFVSFAGVNALALRPDGKIVAGGSNAGPDGEASNFALARYNPDGSLDQSFGLAGTVSTQVFLDEGAFDMTLQSDGKIVEAGDGADQGTDSASFMVIRYLPNGSLDPSFGTGGYAKNALSSSVDAAFGVAIQPDAKIVAAGYAVDPQSNTGDFALARYVGDSVPPMLACAATAPVFALHQAGALVTATVTDTYPGPAAPTVSAPADTSSVGAKTVQLQGADLAGNSATISCPYRVGYVFDGFLPPVDNPPLLNGANAGQTIPLKWRLTDANGVPVTTLQNATVTVETIACPLGVTPDQLEETTSGHSGLQNHGDGSYQFNWATPTSYAHSCKTLRLDLGEGTTHTALFAFTR